MQTAYNMHEPRGKFALWMEIQVLSEYKVEKDNIQDLFQLLFYKEFWGKNIFSTEKNIKRVLVSSEMIKA